MSFARQYGRVAISMVPLLSVLVACARPHETQAPAGQLDNSVTPTVYHIELSIDPSKDRFSGTTVIDVRLNESQDAIWLHGKNLDVSEVFLLDGKSNRVEATYAEELDSGVARVTFAAEAPAGPAELHFTYTAPFNTSANALFKVERDGDFYAATQFEAIAARQVFPSFDQPGFKVPFEIAVTARKGDAVVANTPEVSSEELADGRLRHVFRKTRPLPTYLIALAVGPYDVVDQGLIPPNAVRDRGIPLRGIVARGHGEQMRYALRNTAGYLTALEQYFNTPYPYEKLDLIAMPESFGGAMENAGAITYDEYLLLMDEDSPLDQRRTYATLHAHEMAHMWFGDLVTPKWWNDIWLNESFASWMENKAASSYWPAGQFDRETQKGALGAMANDSLAAAREIREPVDHNDEINGAFDDITYEKGGGVLAMLEHFVGEEKFRDGVRLYLARHADGTATAEDFIGAIAETSNRPEVDAAFKSYIEQPGVPLVSVAADCKDPMAPRLIVRQSRYAPLGSAIKPDSGTWTIPFCASYSAGRERQQTCAVVSAKEQSIALEAAACPTQLHPNADGTGYYRFALDEAGWKSLIAAAATLSPPEALAFADSLDAAFRAGRVSADSYVAGMVALVNHEAWDVADAATGYLEKITNIFDAEKLPPVEQAFRMVAGPRFARLAGGSDPGSTLLHQDLQRFLILVAKDQGMRGPLASQAAAIVGLNGKPDRSAAPAIEYQTILSVGVQDLGPQFFDLLLRQAMASGDAEFRNSAIGALARAEDPAMVQELEAAVLAGNFKGTEILGVLFRQMARAATTEQTYAWLRKNDDAIIAMIPEGYRSNFFPSLGSAFCSNERADEWRQFVISHARQLPGYERDLAQTTESIRLCAALRTRSAADLLAMFGREG
jgi:aminopeptidase N